MDFLVKNFYNTNSKRFSQTRYSIWNVIKEFNNNIHPNSVILDSGCGNGKNMYFLQKKKHNVFGIDFSDKLLEICKNKNLDVINADIRKLPYDDSVFDYVISIAVIHHLSSNTDRINAINEMLRVTKKKGKVLVTVWAVEQDKNSRRQFKLGDNLISFEDSYRYYHIFNEITFQDMIKSFIIEKYYWEKGNWIAILIKC